MSTVGQIERKTQNRVVKLFQEKLDYEYLGNWEDEPNNHCIEEDLLRAYLSKQGYPDPIITRAIYLITKVADDQSKSLYDRNFEIYRMLRYGIKIKPEVGENTVDVWAIDWANPDKNHFAIAEEVTVKGATREKRPDIVLYVNGIALGVLELKRSTVSVSEGIRQNLDNQKKEFIQSFFSTIQYAMAGNDTEGLRYGTIETKEKYYLAWKEDSDIANLLDKHLIQVCEKSRFLELIHDFVVFDAGAKKLCRQNQYFGIKAAQEYVKRREGGIIWHSQGSGKSLTMVWLAKWILGRGGDARVLVITDRKELDDQLENRVFKGVGENIYRAKSGSDLIEKLNQSEKRLMCSLIHKFGNKEEGETVGDIAAYLEELKKSLPKNFKAKGDIYVFVDECHRTQSGELHKAMKMILPNAVFIGFTGTPLLKADKQKSIEVFGKYIHTYKFDEAVKDGVVLDLRYEARDIDQNISSPAKIDQWFELKTKGLTDIAKAQLKQRWGTIQKVLSCQSRLEKIVADISIDMEEKDRLRSGYGNAMLVSGSIYEACKFYELFSKTDLAGKCAIITSYVPNAASIKGEESGEGETEKLHQYDMYKKMLANWFNENPDDAVKKAELFEAQVKDKFIYEPRQMKLLIVVDKLLTGFDAPSATYLYIDKEMRDHALFQAICRVNRLDGEDKEYGYIIDYKDLFKSLEGAVTDYTSGALDGFEKSDVAGLLEDRLEKAKERLDDARETIKALCEPVEKPYDTPAYLRYFCAKDITDKTSMKDSEPKRLALYKLTSAFIRAYSNLANELSEAGYTQSEIASLKSETDHYEKARNEVKLASGDYIDLKMYEPAMRHLIDTYIRAEESQKVSAFDDLSLVQLIVEKGVSAIDALPKGIRESEEALAETIENNVRKLIIDESPINPKYYEKMSELLDALIEKRKTKALDYQQYLKDIIELTKKAKSPSQGGSYPKALDSAAKRALFDNLGKDEALALNVDSAVRSAIQDDWRGNLMKERKVKLAIKTVITDEVLADIIFDIVRSQHEY